MSVDIFGLVPGEDRGPPRRGAPGGGRRAAARQHLRGRRGGRQPGRRPRACCATRRRSWRRSTRWTPRCAAASRCASTSWCARARSATSSRAAPSTPSTSGWSSRRWTRTGRTIFHSGEVVDGGKGPVEPGAHFYRSLHARRARQPDQQAQRLGHALGGLRAADPAGRRRHRPLPAATSRRTAATRSRSRAKVNYRKFAWWNTQWAFAGVRDPEQKDFALGKGYDDGRWVFTGDTSKVSGQVKAHPGPADHRDGRGDGRAQDPAEGRARARRASRYLDRSVRERWNDYGIGLLLQGDLRGAEAAFLKVTEMEPEYADGFVNVARVRLQEGDAAGAEADAAARRSQIDPKLAKTHFFLGSALKAQGRYDEALEHTARGRRPLPARPRRHQPGGPAAVPEAPVPGRDRRAAEGPRRRPRGPAGALQPDAGLPGSGERRDGEASTRRSTSASRPTRRRSSSPGPTGSCTRTTTTSASRSTSMARSSPGQPPARPKAPTGRPGASVARAGAARRSATGARR